VVCHIFERLVDIVICYFGVEILVKFLVEYTFFSIMARLPPLGGLDVDKCGFLHKFLTYV
jgi:hypothetical protein